MDTKIGIISCGSNNLIKVLEKNKIQTDIIPPDKVHDTDLDEYTAFMITGGNSKEPLIFFPKDRIAIDKQIKKGKRVFCEYCESIYTVSFLEGTSTRYQRPVVFNSREGVGLKKGDILDEQCNTVLKLYKSEYTKKPLLQYIENPVGFYKTDIDYKKDIKRQKNALWFENDNLLVCSFRMANFITAKFAPRNKWKSLIQYILKWLTQENIDMIAIDDLYCKTYHFNNPDNDFDKNLKRSIKKAFSWFDKNDMYDFKYGGYNGVKEGYGTSVYPDGTHKKEDTVRLDNTGELSYAWFMKYMVTKDKKAYEISDSLTEFVLNLQVKENGPFYGMVRNGLTAWWNVCYQDDSARGFLLPKLFEMLYTQRKDYIRQVKDCLDFLIETTGYDGLRVPRTDYVSPFRSDVSAKVYKKIEDGDITRWSTDGLITKDVTKLQSLKGNTPSGHYNGYYLASLFLAYKVFKDKKYLDIAKKGMESIKKVYLYTAREHSETQELCRLVLPAAMQYFATGKNKDKEFLYKVTRDLQKYKHKSGAYLEWDTGYTALRNGTKGTECSVLAENGDPVVDMLYSMNFLPVGFIQSYFVTGDSYFKNLWRDTVKFLMSAQIQSEDKTIDGAWARAYDVNLKEVYGVPNDVGWAPWSIETGWTVGEILIGMQQGLIEDKLIKYYN